MAEIEIRYRDHGKDFTFQLPLTAPQFSEIRTEIGEPPYVAHSVVVEALGIVVWAEGSRGHTDISFCPESGWSEFLDRLAEARYEGTAACEVWLEWLEHCRTTNVELILRAVENHDLTFRDIAEIDSSLFDDVRIRDDIVESIKRGDLRQMTRSEPPVPSELWELYELASFLYVSREENSFEAACDAACEQRPDLVPPSWGRDPGGNLKKQAIRRMDRHPLKSQSRDERWPRDN